MTRWEKPFWHLTEPEPFVNEVFSFVTEVDIKIPEQPLIHLSRRDFRHKNIVNQLVEIKDRLSPDRPEIIFLEKFSDGPVKVHSYWTGVPHKGIDYKCIIVRIECLWNVYPLWPIWAQAA